MDLTLGLPTTRATVIVAPAGDNRCELSPLTNALPYSKVLIPMDMLDKTALRRALGSFVTGVTIVTTRDVAGNPVGLTANSFNSVSLDPPLVLWSLALTSHNLDAFRKAGGWAVHILSADQQELSDRFASRGADKFAGLAFEEGPFGVPLLNGCVARFMCESTFEYEGGDHAIFVGEVVKLATAGASPLVFHAGRYSRVLPPSTRPPLPEDLDAGEFGRYFTAHLIGSAHRATFADVRRGYRNRGLRGAQYTVIASLGLADGSTIEDLRTRVARAGVELASGAVDSLVASGHVAWTADRLHLTPAGRSSLVELSAIAQASQLSIEARLSANELAMLHDLLEKLLPMTDTSRPYGSPSIGRTAL